MNDVARTPVRVMVVDDNPVVRSGLASLLEASDVAVIVAEASDGEQAIAEAERSRPDLVLLDVRMPRVDGVEAASPLSEMARVLMLTYSDEPATVRSAIRNGASGYLVHGRFSPEELGRAVTEAVSGASPMSPSAASAVLDAVRRAPEPETAPAVSGPVAARVALGLSVREAEIMQMIADGKSNTDIAGTLFLSEKTVKNHVNRIYGKLGVGSRGAAIASWHVATYSGSAGGP